MVARFLERFEGYSGQEIRDLVPGVTEHDVSRWRRQDFKRLTASKRRALERAMKNGAQIGGGDPARYPDGGVSAANAIIETFGQPDALRRQAGHIPPADAAKAGYALAQRLQLPPAGMQRVLSWYNEIMGGEGADG